MSEEGLRRNADRWYRQAQDDLQSVAVLLEAGQHAQAGFLAQQAAEKALKAVWIALDLDPWGHSVAQLIKGLPDDVRVSFDALLDEALYLDKLYIPTRYPDALAGLIPAEAYTRGEAATAQEYASLLLEQAGRWLKQQGA